MKGKLVWKGGPGSGHHGHQGRPGKVGGSTSNGGSGSGSLPGWEYDDVLTHAWTKKGNKYEVEIQQTGDTYEWIASTIRANKYNQFPTLGEGRSNTLQGAAYQAETKLKRLESIGPENYDEMVDGLLPEGY